MTKSSAQSRMVILICGLVLSVVPETKNGRAADVVPLPVAKPEIAVTSEFASEQAYPDKSGTAPLSRNDIDLYKQIWSAQEKGDFKDADKLIKKLSDARLMGHILYQRYMHKEHRSSFEELKAWLERYADHPGAHNVYRLAQARVPQEYKGGLVKPEDYSVIARVHEPTMKKARVYISERKRSDAQRAAVESVRKKVLALIRSGYNSKALEYLNQEGGSAVLDSTEYDILRADIAAGYLYTGHPETAFNLASESVKRSDGKVPKAAWVAGLVEWRAGRYTKAAKMFEIAAGSPYASGWTQASGAYWAARSHMRSGNVMEISSWLERGMAYPRTFYGLISTRALGIDFNFNWQIPTFTREYRSVLAGIPAGNRAMGLVEIGQSDRAQSELLRLELKTQAERDALLAYSGYANMPALGMRLASALSGPEQNYDGALYPSPLWQPNGGFKIDPALMYAIMRQESRFDPEAESYSGAMGLMQLMPSTARRMAGKGEMDLTNPSENLEIAQKYIMRLIKDKSVKGDLFMLLIAYNAGPGNLAKWQKRWPDVKDPLLFIELIPAPETRAYVERVLANYWIYRLKAEKPVPSLDAITAGKPAHYAEKDLL